MDSRVAFYWMSKAWETGETEDVVWDNLEEKGILACEIRAIVSSLEGEGNRDICNQVVTLTGATLASFLLAARSKALMTWTKLTRNEPDHECKTPNGKPLYGVSWMKKLSVFVVTKKRQRRP